MVLSLYLNIACCYMKMNHYLEARKILDRAIKIAPTNSIVLFRSAQCRTSNLQSTPKQLEIAAKEVDQGIESKKTEKIFQHESGVLNMLGFGNHKEVFEDMKSFIDMRRKDLDNRTEAMVEGIVRRVRELNDIEARIIAEGKVPEEGPCMYRMFGSEDEDMEHFILNE